MAHIKNQKNPYWPAVMLATPELETLKAFGADIDVISWYKFEDEYETDSIRNALDKVLSLARVLSEAAKKGELRIEVHQKACGHCGIHESETIDISGYIK